MTPLRSPWMLLVLALVGCGETRTAYNEPFPSALPAGTEPTEPVAMKKAFAPSAPMSPTGSLKALVGDHTAAMRVAAQPGTTSSVGGSSEISRKIIYDGQVDLVVESVGPIAKQVATLVQNAHGFIAELNVTGSPGSQRSMHWRVRIPVEQFDSVVDAIVALGELERHNRTSQDVTEQYYDLAARIKNKRNEEQTLNKILQERSGKLEDVLKVEIELSRVRGEIEQLEGKIRVLENLSALATLTLNVREREKYAPPPPVVADFSTQIARTWSDSLLGLVNLGKAIVLWAVGWAIWIPLLVVGGALAWALLRWLARIFARNIPRIVALARTPITRPRTPASGE
jgi:polyhydroxyalkanoate synthesis regulator phasin